MDQFIILVKILLFFSFVSTVKINSTKSSNPVIRIIGGEEVMPHSYPFLVGLRINYNSFCGGILISTNYVLTVAHCGEEVSLVTVILGAHRIKNKSERTRLTIAGSSVILHPNYNTTNLFNDIALIKLEETVILNSYIQIAQLPKYSDRSQTYLNEKLTAIGWGLTKDKFGATFIDMSPELQSVDVKVMDLAECQRIFYDSVDNSTSVNSNNICTNGYKSRGTCKGDSGGPLVDSNNVVVGLTSFGTNLCEIDSPSVFTRIDAYLDWIIENSDVTLQ